MIALRPDKEISVKKVEIKTSDGKIKALILSPRSGADNAPGILWIHGGGYFLGMKEMVYTSCAADLVKRYGAVVISPGYRLAAWAPYPAAIHDCYASLLYMKEHASELGIRTDQLMVGGPSAGGGLCAALTMMARDRAEVSIAYQMPLYPMIDNYDTDSSRDNHGKVWNTRRNHLGWRLYLRKEAKKEVSPYAAAARQTDHAGLPPAYTFVGDGEPFYCETLTYIENLKRCGIPAEVDVYRSNMHAFDIMRPKSPLAVAARENFLKRFAYAKAHYFARQPHA